MTWRFLAALGALALLALGVDTAFGASSDKTGAIAVVAPATLDGDGRMITRRIDLIAPVTRVDRSPDFAVGEDGLTVGVLDAVIDENRVAHIVPGTPGQVECADPSVADSCVVVADVLGNAVVWFALLPRGARETVDLPPIVDLQDGYAEFVNGWEVRYAATIERDPTTCGDDVVSFSDFLRRFGPGSTTVVDLTTQQVTGVICGDEFVAPPTTVAADGSLTGAIVTAPTTTVVGPDPAVVPPGT